MPEKGGISPRLCKSAPGYVYKQGWRGLALEIRENWHAEAGSVLCPALGQYPGSYAAGVAQGELGLRPGERGPIPRAPAQPGEGGAGLAPRALACLPPRRLCCCFRNSCTLSMVLSLQDPPQLSEHSQEENKNEKQTSKASTLKGKGI